MNTTGDNQIWQVKLLPWMILMPTFLIIVFIVLSTHQLIRFNESLIVKPDTTLTQALIPLGENKDADYLRWITLVKLEQQSYLYRYNQGSFLLMSRTFKQYLGFCTGMILAIVGSVFIIGKLKESSSKLNIETEKSVKLSFVSSSPGIIFGVLGTLLMLTTLINHNDIVVKDVPLYLNSDAIQALNTSFEFSKPHKKIDSITTQMLLQQEKEIQNNERND